VEACEWLRPRLDAADAAFVTTFGMNQPYIVSAVELGYDPQKWFRDPPEYREGAEYDMYSRVGKLRFLYQPLAPSDVDAIHVVGRQKRLIFVLRVGETALRNPVYVIRAPNGNPVLELYDVLR
jgi:hypothetical protein